ncbi:protein kinase domain-containing protein [Variovorax sp. GT1P44]|uniref:protein kinase domain-containing protein n=1 Tax=Variovorax sp. GT1P44 TaxID=3443742 RepID=UPI003F450594
MAAICPACGTANRPAAKFCKHCVTALSFADAEPEEQPFAETGAPYIKTEQQSRSATAGDAHAGRPDAIHALPEGTEIEGFRILQQIGEGGFGIVYLAWDLALERHVAIKEYMPSSLAVRGVVSMEVSMRSEQYRETFDAGLRSFVNEARLLAKFDHPALVKVFRYWEANGTAYMAMPYYEGPTLKTALSQLGSRAPEALLRAWLDPLLDALTVMHGEQCYHRDISPDNILLTASGPLLLDFGAARHVINDRTQVLTTMLKPGFAPVEQYGGTMLQGAWTDLYALAAVVHYAITGRPPIASVVRVVNDPLQPLSLAHAGQYSAGFLAAMDAALEVRPESRPQDVAAFRAMLDRDPDDIGESMDVAVAAESVRASQDLDSSAVNAPTTPARAVDQASARPRPMRYAVLVAVLFIAGGATWMGMREPARSELSTTAAVPASTASPNVVVEQAREVPASPVEARAATAPAIAPPSSAEPARAIVKEDPGAPPIARPSVAAPSPRAIRKAPTAPRPPIAPIDVATSASEKKRTVSEQPETVSSYTQTGRPPRCSDLVLKSSLEPLNPEEAAFQKTRCK